MQKPIKLVNGNLTSDAIQSYHDNGFLTPIQTISSERAAHFRTELEQMENTWLDNGLPKPLNSYKRVNAQCVMPLAYEIGSDPAILDVVEGILGPDILIYAVEFFIKELHTKHVVSMHQDLTYWGLGAIDGLVTAWVALSPATRASGCMDFVRASHKNPILPHADTFDDNNLLSRGQEIQVDVAEEDKVSVELQPGQMSLHHGLMIHGSGPNSSDDRRIGAVIRYVTPDVALESGEKDFAIPVRGNDTLGNFLHYDPPSGYFSAKDLTTYDRIRAQQNKAQAAGTARELAYDKET